MHVLSNDMTVFGEKKMACVRQQNSFSTRFQPGVFAAQHKQKRFADGS
jgi:ribosomal protein S27AE